MERLIIDASKLSDTVDAQSASFANVVEAIHVIQTEMGIAGTTAAEASTTIQGSLGSLQAAWTNLLTGLSDENANIGELVNNLVETFGTYLGNLIPIVEQTITSVGSAIENISPILSEKIPSIIDSILPVVLNASLGMVNSIASAIPGMLNTIVDIVPKLINTLISTALTLIPQIIGLAFDLVVSLANGIGQSLPELVPAAIDAVMEIVDTLTSPAQINSLLDAALTLVVQLGYGLMEAIPKLVNAAVTLVNNLVVFLLDPMNLAKLINAALQLVISLGTGLINAIPLIVTQSTKMIAAVVDTFKKTKWGDVGKQIVNGVLNGLKSAWSSLTKWFTNSWNNLISSSKKLLGIHSPSTVFAGIGKNTALGFGEGWEDQIDSVRKNIDDSLSFNGNDFSIPITKTISGNSSPFSHTSFNGLTINVNGANVQNDEELAQMIAQKLQEMTERRNLVYA